MQSNIADNWMADNITASILQIFIRNSYHCLRSWWLNDKQFALTANIKFVHSWPGLGGIFNVSKVWKWMSNYVLPYCFLEFEQNLQSSRKSIKINKIHHISDITFTVKSGWNKTFNMEAPAVAGEQVRYDMDQGYPQGYTQQEVEGKINKKLIKS